MYFFGDVEWEEGAKNFLLKFIMLYQNKNIKTNFLPRCGGRKGNFCRAIYVAEPIFVVVIMKKKHHFEHLCCWSKLWCFFIIKRKVLHSYSFSGSNTSLVFQFLSRTFHIFLILQNFYPSFHSFFVIWSSRKLVFLFVDICCSCYAHNDIHFIEHANLKIVFWMSEKWH